MGIYEFIRECMDPLLWKCTLPYLYISMQINETISEYSPWTLEEYLGSRWKTALVHINFVCYFGDQKIYNFFPVLSCRVIVKITLAMSKYFKRVMKIYCIFCDDYIYYCYHPYHFILMALRYFFFNVVVNSCNSCSFLTLQ